MKLFRNIPKIILYIGAGLLLVLVLAAGYSLLSSKNTGSGGVPSTDFFSSLFPFGNGNAPARTGGGNTVSTGGEGERMVPLLRKVSDRPTAGAWFSLGSATNTAPHIRFVERATGHVFETPADSYTETRVSNTTIPGIQDAVPVSDTTFLIRQLDLGDTIKNFFATLNATSSEQSVAVLPEKPYDRVALFADGTSMFTLTALPNGSRAEVSKPDGTLSKVVFTSPIRSWVPLTGGKRIFVETAPAAEALGFLYEIKSGTLQKMLGGILGMSATVSPSGRYVAYSTTVQGRFALFVFDTKTGNVFAAPIGTLTEKCAWIATREPLLFCTVPSVVPAGRYPDDWLLGQVSLSDEAWIIDSKNQTAYFVADMNKEAGAPIDAEKVRVDNGGAYALFTNKNDLAVWELRIGGVLQKIK